MHPLPHQYCVSCPLPSHSWFWFVCGLCLTRHPIHVLPSLVGMTFFTEATCIFLKFYFPSLTQLMEILSTIEQDGPLQKPDGNMCCQSEDNMLGHVFAGRCSWKPCFPSFSWLKSRHPTSTTSPFPSHPVKEGNEFGFSTMCSWRIHSGFF